MAKVFEIKAALKGLSPEIYRILKVNSKISLQILHEVFQAAFFWENYHLHFYKDAYGNDIKKELLISLDQVLTKNQNVTYVYDFGDSWTVEIALLSVFEDNKLDNYPVCTGGARHAPPEDSGGVTGYELALELIKTKEKRNYTLITEWYGDAYDPEHFDTEEVNQKLTHLKGI
jgi:hypothetical protein